MRGPFRNMELTGIAAHAAVMQDLFPDLGNSTEVPRTILDRLEQGKTGARAGAGFYEYEPDESEHWNTLMRQFMWESCQLMPARA